jgi:hypothetical protein
MAYPSKPNPKNLSRRCQGYGTLTCYCGGDLCVCGLDGEECPGCPDCEGLEEEQEDYFFCSCGAELSRLDNPQQCTCLREHGGTTIQEGRRQTGS